ncbi:MAG: hypothetical protein OIF38_00725, partial [Cellvibrionaceae bacterium]|nr:hypothetical protein [Cellvibrionaceae bacterium]
GKIVISIGANQVGFETTGPQYPERVLFGKTSSQALHTLPLLFSLCGHAHHYCGHLAVAKAQGQLLSPRQQQRYEFLLELEHSRELLMGILQKLGRRLPQGGPHSIRRAYTFLGQCLGQSQEAFTAVPPKLAAIHIKVEQLEQLLKTKILGGPCEKFVNIHNAQGLTHFLQGRALGSQLSSMILDHGWASIGANAFKQHSIAEESGPLMRLRERPLIQMISAAHGHGLLARLFARLLELAEAPGRLRRILKSDYPGDSQAECTANLEARAQVQTSRGLLRHQLSLAAPGPDHSEYRVANYRIDSPTAANFSHNSSLAGTLLEAAKVANEQKQLLDLIVQLYDPCLPWELKLNHA